MNLVASISLLLSFSALAQSSDDYENLTHTIKRVSENKAAECPIDNHQSSEFWFVFDGANGFCPIHYETHKPSNVPRGNWHDYLYSIPASDPLYELRQSMIAAENLENENQNCNLIESLLDRQRISSDLYGGKNTILYYSKDDDELAHSCAQQLIESRISAGEKAPLIRVMGYSMGGEAAINLAEKLKNEGHPVEAGLTIDPVGRGMRWTKSVISKDAKQSFDVTGLSHKEWINVYQRLDKKSLKVSGIQGEEVLGAENTDFSDFISKNKEYRNYAHVWILETSELRERINRWIYN